MMVSLERILNINHVLTNEIKSILCIGHPAFWNTVLFTSCKMKMIHESEAKKHLK